MMFNSKMVCCLKANGKILREFKDNIFVPFGSEYSLVLKNLNSVRAIVNIIIDGEDVAPGGLVVNPGQTVDLERSIKDGNLKSGNKFKFIEKTAAVEQHRGNKLEDGVITIKYKFERVHVIGPAYAGLDPWTTKTVQQPWYPTPGVLRKHSDLFGPIIGQTDGPQWSTNATLNCATFSATSCSDVSFADAAPSVTVPRANDAGITVAGSESKQQFITISDFPTEQETYVIAFKLLGETADNQRVLEPVTVKTKIECSTCGTKSKSGTKFCPECGTSLIKY